MRKLIPLVLLVSGIAYAQWANFLTTLTWGGSGATVQLTDGGSKVSNFGQLENTTAAMACTCFDGGCLGQLVLYGSLTSAGTNAVQLGTPIVADGGTNTYAWDPITSGFPYIAVGLDGGTGTSGMLVCAYQQRGNVP
jgi:hypothetical protein